VAGAPDIVHQIEYRWHDRRDLSPAATTMPRELLPGWDAWIREWVRHPHCDWLWESVCYQVQGGRAALAWRYENPRVIEREDGTRDRPLVSRVLAGAAERLTPQVAIALCRTGLPDAAGPRPGQVRSDADLRVIPADELTGLADGLAGDLDKEAARQQGLQQVVASALSDPRVPLAIHIRDTHLFRPLAEGVQGPLMWGLWRIAGPLLGSAARGWSFSTFELPLGAYADPETLPAVLFRQAQDIPSAPPARPRQEVKSRPFDPSARRDTDPEVQLAGWLVAVFQEKHGDELGALIGRWCRGEREPWPRVFKVYEELQRIHPAPVAEPAAGPVPAAGPEHDPLPEPIAPDAPDQDEVVSGQDHVAADQKDYLASDQDHVASGQDRPPSGQNHLAHDQDGADGAPVRDENNGGRGSERPRPPWDVPTADYREPVREAHGAPPLGQPRRRWPAAVSELIRLLPRAADRREFDSIVACILGPDARSDSVEQILARREMCKQGWYENIRVRFGDVLTVDTLAAMFTITGFANVHDKDATAKIGEWAERAQPPVIAGFLTAARRSGEDEWHSMMRILEGTLAYQWMLANSDPSLWDTRVGPPPAAPRRRLFGWFRGSQ